MEKKQYAKIDAPPLGVSLPSPGRRSGKKIVATKVKKDLRETFRKTFLPLLIDLFELRQSVQTHKLCRASPTLAECGEKRKSPETILAELLERRVDVEETLLWCQGVLVQIDKGIEEAKQVIDDTDDAPVGEV